MAESAGRRSHGHGWCSLRLRFDDRELGLLASAEHLRGAQMAHQARPDELRSALSLAKAGQKVRRAGPGSSVVLDEAELVLLVGALRLASTEIQWAAGQRDPPEGTRVPRRDAVLQAFPEFVERGLWRSFGVCREIDALAARLDAALSNGM